MATPGRSAGMKLIITYKLIKSFTVGVLVVVVSVWPHASMRVVEHVVAELIEAPAFWSRVGAWMQARLSAGTERLAAMLLAFDATTTGIEGLLLLTGRAWAEWVVVCSLGLLLVLELVAIERRTSVARLVILTINAGVIAYLLVRRLRRAPA